MFELILNVFINRYASGKFPTESGQSKTAGVGIDVEKSCIAGSDEFIYLTPNEKKRLRQKRYRLRKASSDDFKQCERDRINAFYSNPDNYFNKKMKMRHHYAKEDNSNKKKKMMQEHYANEEIARKHRGEYEREDARALCKR